MKESGVEWIGEIPNHWNPSKIKYHFRLISGFPFNSEDITNEEREFPIIRIGNVTSGNIDVYFDGMSSDKHTIVEKGDYIVSLTGDFSIREWERGKSLLNQRCGLLKPYPLNNSIRLLFYFLPFQFKILEKTKYFTTLKNLSNSELLDLEIVLPPLPEQEQIVKYLDEKTSQIDQLISITEKKIEGLKEKRTSLINHVVTKGLDSNIEMKESGVEWIGKIPKHWRYIPLKYVSEKKGGIQTGPFGTQLNTKDYVKDGVKVMNQKTLIDENYAIGEEYISFEKFNELKGFEVLEGDLIMGTRGSFGNGTRTTFGKCSIVPEGVGISVLHPCLIRIRLLLEQLRKDYFYYYVNQSDYFLEDIQNTSNSTTIEVIYGITLKEIRFPIPPIDEQKQIVEYLDTQTSEIDKLVSIERQRILTLKEYRQSLISEVVTGKINVTKIL
jgi:type I restriction enzyme S subunit